MGISRNSGNKKCVSGGLMSISRKKRKLKIGWQVSMSETKAKKISVVRRGEKFRCKAIEFDCSEFKWI